MTTIEKAAKEAAEEMEASSLEWETSYITTAHAQRIILRHLKPVKKEMESLCIESKRLKNTLAARDVAEKRIIEDLEGQIRDVQQENARLREAFVRQVPHAFFCDYRNGGGGGENTCNCGAFEVLSATTPDHFPDAAKMVPPKVAQDLADSVVSLRNILKQLGATGTIGDDALFNFHQSKDAK